MDEAASTVLHLNSSLKQRPVSHRTPYEDQHCHSTRNSVASQLIGTVPPVVQAGVGFDLVIGISERELKLVVELRV